MGNFYHVITKSGKLVAFHERDFIRLDDNTLCIFDRVTNNTIRINLTNSIRNDLMFNQFGMSKIKQETIDNNFNEVNNV